jgi:hypothetical protein
MRSLTKAGEPQKLEQPLLDTEESPVETFNVISDDLSKYWDDWAERLEALEKRADKPTFPMEYSSSELNAVGKEVSKLAELGRIYLRLAYVKYLLAVGLSVDDANFLADSLYASKQNIYEKVEHAEWAFRSRNLLAI